MGIHKGLWVIPPEFDRCYRFFGELAVVRKGDVYSYIRRNGETVWTSEAFAWVCQPGMAHFDHLIWPPQVKKSSSSSRLSFFCVCWLLFCASILQVVYRCRHDRIFHLSRLFEGFGMLVPNLAELLDLLAKVFRVVRREGLLLDF